MRNLGLEVLELFAEASEQSETYIGKDYSRVRHDRAKREWRAKNTDLQRIYTMRSYYRKRGLVEKMPPIEIVKVEIFWDGDGWYYAKPQDSERLGGPFEKLHAAWKSADKKRLEVSSVSTTRGQRTYR